MAGKQVTKETSGVKQSAAARPSGRSAAKRKRAANSAATPSAQTVASPQAAVQPPQTRIGVVADTHGYLDPRVLTIFAGVDLIIHAGDIVDPATLAALKEVAPLTAVAGNLDPADLAASLLREATGEVGGVSFVVSHKRKRLLKRLAAGKIAFGAAG
ncbi:MAG: metallophosphoesterase family protein, partial [Thermoleophilia bacterium]